jgi:catechol-2,3-dioxygenase
MSAADVDAKDLVALALAFGDRHHHLRNNRWAAVCQVAGQVQRCGRRDGF